ncbi:MAG: hypothetical protein H6610_00885 [Ignavibacteriales bacterium]|nr:hypothetical protein [Ignavibacteriales bacterium]MCB9217995.1 hypothetical protein [Ignavibacteriales bacterium]
MKPARKISLVFILLFIFNFCSDKYEVEKNRLAHTYVDLLVVEDLYKDTDSLLNKRAKVFEKYSLTEELYDSAYKRMTFNIEEWDNFFELANTYLDSLKAIEKESEQKKR